MSEVLILSEKLGKAVVHGDGVIDYASALMHGRSDSLTYEDLQEFRTFTEDYFTAKIDGELVLFRKADGVALRLIDDTYQFEPDGTSVSDYADKL